MEKLRHGAAILGGVWVGMWLARIVGWIFGLDGLVLGAVALAFSVLGGVAGHARGKELPPLDSRERRDAVLGWSFVGAIVGVLAIVALIGF
jgi:hypothetical protein